MVPTHNTTRSSIGSTKRSKSNTRPPTNPLKAQKVAPDFVQQMPIPIRENKQDVPGPHQKFEVAMTHDKLRQKLKVIATNLEDTRDYFEIKVDGNEEIKRVMDKFHWDFNMIADSLRIMNDVMVLLNPRMLNNSVNQTIES
eukprot:CAMPEP_0170451924 /NCGR_PEP_ID=MMETSP0123-20130129/1002_1 /TAXON_ID=182087 /ORGANISM="Favella ehrenbergii, Strain Fehren 1" /LENGTH=140 /DNA_ID=CAMNT_0010713775 /DNA_START=1276 /DNA_END=1698 /DNA_ORIENTATION=-